MSKRYWVSRNGNASGPYGTADLQLMLTEGEIETSDQIRIPEGQGEGSLPARSVLDGKPSLLQREWALHQSRQAGIVARLLMAGTVVVSGINGARGARPVIYALLLVLVTTLVAVQAVKGPRRAAVLNFILAWVATPAMCYLVSWLAGGHA